jgi:transposase
MPCTSTACTAALLTPSACRVPRSRRGDGWDALADLEVFVFAVEAELEAMERERVGVHRRGRKPDLALRRRLIGLIWALTFGGMQWRVAGWLSGVPFTTLHSTFARWTRLGLWRRLGRRLALDWRLAQGDEVLPSAVVVDSRSLRSAPTAWTRGIDGGKLIKGVKLLVICDKHGSLLDLELQPANVDDRAGALPMLPRLTALGFQGDLLGDSGFKGGAAHHGRHARARHPRLGLARWNAGRTLPAERHPLGGRAASRLVEPLPTPQCRVRPRARPLRRARLDRDDLDHLAPARRPIPGAARDLIAYSF